MNKNSSKRSETLVEKARKLKPNRLSKYSISDEHINLALAWAKDEISFTQVKDVLDSAGTTQVYTFLAMALRKHIQK